MAKAFRDLRVWQLAMDLATEVYKLSEAFPRSEMYGLTAQLRRCSVSVASNIAEGSGRASKRDFANFVSIARGSNYEVETQVLLALRLGYCTEAAAQPVLDLSAETGKLLKGLRNFLQHSVAPQPSGQAGQKET